MKETGSHRRKRGISFLSIFYFDRIRGGQRMKGTRLATTVERLKEGGGFVYCTEQSTMMPLINST